MFPSRQPLRTTPGSMPKARLPPVLGKTGNDGHQVLLDKDEEKDYESDGSDIWEGFSILKRVGGSTNSGNRCTSCLDSFHSDAESNAGPDLNGARRALTMCVITTGLSLVEGIGLQRLVHDLNPLIPQSRFTLDRDLMSLHRREKNTLHSIISETSGGLSFAVDKWRSKGTRAYYNDDIYLCVTACFVDAAWKLQRRIVGFKLMEFPNDVTSVVETIALCFSELKFDKKVIGITLDNDTLNNVEYEASMPDSLKTVLHDKCKLLWDGEFCQVHCLTDILNCAVQASLKLIADIISKIRNGIRYINYHSAISVEAFYQFAKDICHLDDTMKLRADMVVTWDSTYKMLGCAMHYRDALTHFASIDETFLSKYHLSHDEWNKVEIVEKFLKPLYDITCTFVSTECKTANLYFLGVYKVYRLLEVTKEHNNFMSAMVKDIKVKFDKYWVECSPILACAAVLDPRYKLNLVRYCFRKVYGEAGSTQHIDRVVALLHRLLAEYKTSSCSSLSRTNVVEYHAKDGLFDDYTPEVQTSELDWYLDSPAMDLNTDLNILEFWSGMSKCYPDLANLARDILAVPISTVPSKSAFNTQGKILNCRRGRLSPDLLEMIVCLHDWTCPKDKNGIAVSAIEELSDGDDDDDDDDDDGVGSDDDEEEEEKGMEESDDYDGESIEEPDDEDSDNYGSAREGA